MAEIVARARVSRQDRTSETDRKCRGEARFAGLAMRWRFPGAAFASFSRRAATGPVWRQQGAQNAAFGGADFERRRALIKLVRAAWGRMSLARGEGVVAARERSRATIGSC
jgi:hypothetical protein